MDLKLGYQELLDLIKKLPASQIKKLKKDLSENLIERKAATEISIFQKFLLTAPVMSDTEHETFLENRKIFNSWKIR